MDGSLHVFRVRPRALPTPIAPESSGPAILEHSWTRRSHNKSRGGCEACRTRRKKCDERRPICSLCLQKHSACTYPNSPLCRRNPLDSFQSNVTYSLWPGQQTLPVLADEKACTKYDLVLLHHFVTISSQHFKSLGFDGILSSKAVELGKEHSSVLHAMLAVSACHLQGLGCKERPYRIAETLHCEFAIRGLQRAVVSFNGVKEADSVLTTSMLLNTYAYIHTAITEESSDDTLKRDAGRLDWGWLRLQIGITEMLVRTKPYHPQSIWLPMFLSSKQPLPFAEPCNDLDQQLAIFCGINPTSTAIDNPYVDLMEQLAPLVIRTHGPQYMRWYVEALGGIDLRFIDLLEKEDVPALMLFAHWAAMMSSIGAWGTSRRLKKICWRICQIMLPRIKASELYLLDVPAEAAGFSLNLRFEIEQDI
ncbi:uncharacterized protein CC84DRAFT_1230752 [Paraphaeosphaeria sporulosa]|uniref:Zn(2)-C6 fungal-type domain-containing protein n=1 Tax=Paraphaeosphaeria sporulosa TaxID=1460663 RepID=A0A177BZD6_9PLEO|nr:uncharacterized protein CC84DRAFT_1230752 [Paraphaeosphaeria sporulosa]OAG00585.1 hypothetical protein CC84DRAFT_1230752 [Paraphaeosphaeria sporulosa]